MDIQNTGNVNISSQNSVATQAPSQASQIATQQAEIKSKEVETETQSQPLNETQVSELVDQLNKALDPFNTTVRFGFDNKDDTFYVSVKDSETDKEIRRFPAAKGDSLLSKMQELTGILFDERG